MARNFVFCGGQTPTSTVFKVDIATMLKDAESDDYGILQEYLYATVRALTSVGDYIYCGGTNSPENRIWQIDKSDMSYINRSTDYSGQIQALTNDGTYIYCGGSSPYEVWKIDPADMSKIDSILYNSYIFALDYDGTYIYCGGQGARVWKIDPTDMSKVDESASYGGRIHVLVNDGTHIYCAGADTDRVYKIRISDMVKVDQSADYGTTIRGLTVFDGYVYCGGDGGGATIWKIDISDMSKVDESDAYGGSIYEFDNDGTNLFCVGSTTKELWKIDVSDMSKVSALAYGAHMACVLVALAPTVGYDYPIYPVIFPLET